MKRVPSFWWDFDWSQPGRSYIVVQSNHEKYPNVKRFPFVGDAGAAIDEAEALIAELKSGRQSLKRLAFS